MIVVDQIEQKPVLSSCITETNQFSIKSSAKAFHILSTSLYSNTRLAILRELGCNARDSHVEAGQTKPWRLHLPTVANPMLEVEDYGVGLNHEQVMNLFTTFFESTKTNSNEFVGALGLGSKSPFSYTDNFTVVAVKNGTRNVYSAYKTESGVPAIARMHTEATEQGNGVLIQIAVKSQDFYDFENNARTAYAFFDQLPTCNKYLEKTTTKPFVLFDTDLGVEHCLNLASSSVVMGGIAYKIDLTRNEFQPYGNLLSHNLILRAKIGDVEMTPSREGLTYNKQTLDWIVSRLEDVMKKIQDELEKKASTYTSKWELAKFLVEQKRNKLYFANVQNLIKKYFPNGMPILQFSKEELEDNGIKLTKYVKKTTGPGKTKLKNQPEAIRIIVENYEFRYSNYNFMFDDSNVRVMDMLSCKVEGTIYLFQSKNPNAVEFIKKKLSETQYSLMMTSSSVKKILSEKREKTVFYQSKLVETGGYYNGRKALKFERVSRSIPSTAKYWIQLHGTKVDENIFIGKDISSVEVNDFIKNNASEVVGFSKTTNTSKGKLVNLVEKLQSDFYAELARANTPEGLLEAVLQLWVSYGNGLSLDSSGSYIDMLDDKLLVKMIRAKKSSTESFKHLNRIRSAVSGFDDLYKQVSNHISDTYSMINFHGNFKSTKAKIDLMNYVFNNK
jgi:hypothetical protein